MSKTHVRTHRKDQADSHVHRLPDGSYSGPALYKPNKDRTFPHTHLYEQDGHTKETCEAPIGGDHIHVSEAGDTSGPIAAAPKEGDTIARTDHMDRVSRVGTKWVVYSESGHRLGEHPTKEAAQKQLQDATSK